VSAIQVGKPNPHPADTHNEHAFIHFNQHVTHLASKMFSALYETMMNKESNYLVFTRGNRANRVSILFTLLLC